MAQPDNIENVRVGNVTWKQLIWVCVTIIGGLMSIEGTILGIYFDTKSQIVTNSSSIKELREEQTSLRSNVNAINTHNSGVDEAIKNIKDFITYRYAK